MQEAVTGQLLFFFASVMFGAFLLFVYDIIRGFRRVFIHKAWLASMEDFLFWLFVGVSSFWFLCWYNQGELRGFFFMGLGLGMLIYYKGLSHQIIKGMVWIFGEIRFLGGKVLKFFCRPVSRVKHNVKWQLKKEKKQVKMALKRKNKRGDIHEGKR